MSTPVGPYYPTGFKPTSLYAESEHIRAAPKGAGMYKLGSNYAPTLAISRDAEIKGFN